MTDHYAVFGNPVEHSRSPQIHKLFAEQTGEDIVYEKQLVEPESFKEAADCFFKAGSATGKGLNITVPFKVDAFHYADQLSKRARQAGAVNTLALQEDGSVFGDNTDGAGMVNDITENLGWTITDKNILVIGAGGAVRGVLGPLLEKSPKKIVIANRTVEKAKQLSRAFHKQGKLAGCGFEDLSGHSFDLVINGTSASLSGDLPPLPENLLADGACCYDMMYGNKPTVFMEWAEKNGCKNIADGLGMLVGQAAESFFIWRGVRPDTFEVIKKLSDDLPS